jgi:UrcA family protein
MNTRRTRRIGTVVISALLLSVAQGALASDRDARERTDSISSTINVRDVDLSTPHGARWVYRRIVSTAKAICWKDVARHDGVHSYSTQLDHARRCFDDSVNRTLARVNEATGVDIERLAGLDRYDEAGFMASVSD